MTLKIDVDYKKNKSAFYPTDDIFESYDTAINFIYNGKSFFESFSPITKDSEMAKFIVHSELDSSAFTYDLEHAKFPLFSMVMDINFGLKQISLNEIVIMTHDTYQTEFVFYRDKEGIHIFFHLKYDGLWYDGNKIFFTRQVPVKSSFVVNTNEFICAFDDFINQLQEYLSINHLDLVKDPLVKRSFGNDKRFNDYLEKNKRNNMISE
ncbi:hypothetical protein [Neobacillus niacini]|uniref:hypothetical protein n=1 Tax=Neobacillus niacini TaxID=86668 RepID=UPI0028625A05|nr:hypothetical protein [Neobacillus niacini]MDR7000168.1 hypothetical protein [Neobacillus niacini]